METVELPAGPAIRVRRVEYSGQGPAGDRRIESALHVVAPPEAVGEEGVPVAIELVMSWSLLHESEALTEVADQTAALLRVLRN